MPTDAREERQRNPKALAIAAVILAIAGAAAYRPATILGVDGDALARSLGVGAFGGPSKCAEMDEGRWRCKLFQGSDGLTVEVETRAFGCWDLIGREATGEGGFRIERSGCVNAFDLIGPF